MALVAFRGLGQRGQVGLVLADVAADDAVVDFEQRVVRERDVRAVVAQLVAARHAGLDEALALEVTLEQDEARH